jgi:hypothetical protein
VTLTWAGVCRGHKPSWTPPAWWRSTDMSPGLSTTFATGSEDCSAIVTPRRVKYALTRMSRPRCEVFADRGSHCRRASPFQRRCASSTVELVSCWSGPKSTTDHASNVSWSRDDQLIYATPLPGSAILVLDLWTGSGNALRVAHPRRTCRAPY